MCPLISCKKWLDYPPEGSLREDLFNTASDAQETLNSCYDALANTFNGRIQAISELLSDNLQQPNADNDLKSVFARQTTFFNGNTIGVYKDLYTVIWRCNTLLANIDFITDIDESTKSKLIAEAKFLRGFCHWSAVKLWAQPYGYTADNSHLGVPVRDKAAADPILRSTVKEVYDFVIADLTAAYDALPVYNSIYASKYSAAGLLAQVYFLMSDYNKAVEYSDAIINSGVYTLLPTLERMPEIYNAAACRHPLISEYYE
ncbi:MAG: RagB/SusD family nutrient uptake outer membrane protein, partial [Flavobacteriales bacterium]